MKVSAELGLWVLLKPKQAVFTASGCSLNTPGGLLATHQ